MTKDMLEQLSKAVPFFAHLGMELTDASKEQVIISVVPQPEHCTSANTVHGGFLMTLADCAGALASYLNLPEGSQGTTTTESKTNMLRPGQPGKDITATATPIHIGRRLQVWQTRVEQDGKLISLTTQTQINL